MLNKNFSYSILRNYMDRNNELSSSAALSQRKWPVPRI